MKTYIMVVLLGICLLGLPFTSSAALDWRIKWDETESFHTAKVYIFNPEDTLQSFTLEIGDVAQTSDSDPSAPYLIVGQDVSLRNIAPSERKIFDIIVYKDFDPQQALSTTMDARASQLGIEQHRQQMRVLGERYGTSSSREYPVEITKVEPVPRDGATNRLIYQSRRGYWITTLIDHDHIAEQLIRTGDRMGATYSSIQQAIYYYTQGSVQLTGEAAEIWETAFPELKTELTPTPYPYGDCMYFVTMVTSNLSAYSAGRSISVGDILASNNSSLSRVVAAEDLDFTVSPNTPTSKRTLRVYLMSQRGKPTEQSEYVQIINHSSQLEQVIRVGIAERYHACAIQEVIYYINGEISSLTIGKGLWDRLGGGGTGGIQPTPTQPVSGSQSICLGNPTTQPGKMAAMTFKNLIVLVGAVVPFGLFMRRKNPKD
jgi:hypothetical protein